MRLIFLVIWLLIAFALVPPAVAAPAPEAHDKDVMVMSFGLRGAVPEVQARRFEDTVLNEATNFLSPEDYRVWTRETAQQAAADKGIDLAKAECTASCTLGFAREVKLRIFIAGQIDFDETAKAYSATVNVFRTDTGANVVAVEVGPFTEFVALRQAFKDRAEKFFTDALGRLDPSFVERREKRERERREKERAEREALEEEKNPGGLTKVNPIADLGGRLVVRGGLGGLGGVLGVGLEWHLPNLAIGLGYGRYATAGITWKPFPYIGRTRGGPYVDVHVAKRFQSTRPDQGAGITAGWDFRPVNWLSLKAGAGVVYTTLWTDAQPRPLVVDLSGGLVF